MKDPARAAEALDRLARAAPQLGFAMARQPAAGVPRWRVRYGPAELQVAIDGRRLLVAGGPGRLEALLASGPAAYRPPGEVARAALSGGAGGAVLDLGRLVASFRALPAEAYGSGPDAFVMRSLAERVIDPAARLVDAALRLELAEGAALLELTVEARPPEEQAR